MKTLTRSFLSATFALMVPLTAVSVPANAVESAGTPVSASFASQSNKLDKLQSVQGEKRVQYAKTAIQHAESKAVLEDGQHLNSKPHVVKELEDGNIFVSDRIEGAAEGSVITVVMTPGGELVTTYQITLEEISESSGVLKTYVDGQLDKDQVVYAPEDGGVASRGMDWGGLNDCLSNAGIASWAIAGLSIACGAACAATAGAGCIACLTAASSATGGTIGYCAGENWS